MWLITKRVGCRGAAQTLACPHGGLATTLYGARLSLVTPGSSRLPVLSVSSFGTAGQRTPSLQEDQARESQVTEGGGGLILAAPGTIALWDGSFYLFAIHIVCVFWLA